MNKYSLLNYDMDAEEPDMKAVEEVTQEVEKLLWEFSDKYAALARKYPGAGLGDTATDECVADDFYQIVHFGCITKRPKYCKKVK